MKLIELWAEVPNKAGGVEKYLKINKSRGSRIRPGGMEKNEKLIRGWARLFRTSEYAHNNFTNSDFRRTKK